MSITDSPTTDSPTSASPVTPASASLVDVTNNAVSDQPPNKHHHTPLNPQEFTVTVPGWRRPLDHLGITGSTVKPRWRLNAELARFAIAHPKMTSQQRNLIDYAAKVESEDVDSAWTALNQAKRIELGNTTDEAELRMRGRALQVEAEQKLTDWRQSTAAAAFGDAEDDPVPTAEALVQVQELIDQHNDNRYRQMAIHARSLRYIGALVVAVLVGFGFVIGFDSLEFPATSVLSSFGSYIGVIVLGAMGALLSVFMSRIAGPDANPLKDLSNRVSGYVRPLLGSLSAVVVVLVLESGVQSVITLGENGIFVGALLAGFSERLIDRALGGIAS